MNILEKIFGKKQRTYDFAKLVGQVKPEEKKKPIEQSYNFAEVVAYPNQKPEQKEQKKPETNYENTWVEKRELKLLEKVKKDLENKAKEGISEESKETDIAIISVEQLAEINAPSILEYCVEVYENPESVQSKNNQQKNE